MSALKKEIEEAATNPILKALEKMNERMANLEAQLQDNKLHSLAEAAEELGVSTQTIRKRIHDGLWECTRHGKLIKFTRQQLEAIKRK